jgi:hypothetical protein
MLHTLMLQKESLSMAIRASKFHILSAAIAIVASGLAAPVPAVADEDPHYRPQPTHRVHVQRERVRTRTVVAPQPIYYTYTCGGCASVQQYYVQAPAYYAPAYTYQGSCGGCAPTVAYVPAPRYYDTGCGDCAQPVVMPYTWQQRYHSRHAHYDHRHVRHYDHGHMHYGYR